MLTQEKAAAAKALPTFTDREGRDWTLRLTFISLREIRDATEIDLGDVPRIAQSFGQIMYDDELAFKVLWLVIASQAAARNVSQIEWIESLDGEILQHAIQALDEAVVLFTRPQKRGLVIAALAKLKEGYALAIQQSVANVEAITEESIERALTQLGGNEPSAPESLATSMMAGRSAKPAKLLTPNRKKRGRG